MPGKGSSSEQKVPGGAGDAAIADLRDIGADRLDPVRFRFIEALARRAAHHQGALRRSLDDRLARALADYRARYERVRLGGEPAGPNAARSDPGSVAQWTRLQAAGDLHASRLHMHQPGSGPQRGPLGALVDAIERQNLQPVPAGEDAGARPQAVQEWTGPELKTLRRFRDTWTRLRIDRQLSRSRQMAPENPGPLNSHQLVLRALRRMQDISPAYLENFMAHVDTLLWLDQAQTGPVAAAPRRPARAPAGRKQNTARSRER